MAAQPDELTLEMTRVLPAAPPVVFGAFTDANELAKWWGPEGFSISSLEFDPRVGASYRIEMQPPECDQRAWRDDLEEELDRQGPVDGERRQLSREVSARGQVSLLRLRLLGLLDNRPVRRSCLRHASAERYPSGVLRVTGFLSGKHGTVAL